MTAVKENPRYEVARWPAGPVLELMERRGLEDKHLRAMDPPIYIKADRPLLTTRVADRIACELLGLHPVFIWPDWLDVPDADEPEQQQLWAS